MNHPDVQAPWAEWSEAQTLHVVVSYSNPFRWHSRRRLVNDNIRHLKSCPNVELYLVELAYGDRPFEVTDEFNDNHIQLRTQHELFHKENMQKVGITRFPAGWKYGCAVDGDFHFTRHDWALETIHQLQHYDFVQPFSSYADLSGSVYGLSDVPVRYSSGFFFNYVQNGYKVSPQYHNGHVTVAGTPVHTPDNGSGYGAAMGVQEGPFMRGVGATGGALAFRSSAYNAVGGLMDRCILGHADWSMAFQLVGIEPPDIHLQNYHPHYKHYVKDWGEKAKLLNKNVGYTDGHCLHYWHGSKTRRAYSSRDVILARHQYDPYSDVIADYQGVWQLTDRKPELRDDIRRYFISRQEDDPNLGTTERLVV